VTVPDLDEASGAIRWIHGEAANRGVVPPSEALDLVDRVHDAPASSELASVSHPLDDEGEYTTIHALNVALLAMGLARHLAFDRDEILAIGLAGLLHDVGRVRPSPDAHDAVDPSSPEARARVMRHPEDGARLLLDSGSPFALAAVVAYEHHLDWQGKTGYPRLHFGRHPHQFSRIVSVCDTFDVLLTERSYRAGLTPEAARHYLPMLSGSPLDPELVTGFLDYVKGPFARIAPPATTAPAALDELGWLPETGFDPDFEPRPVRL